MQDERDVSNIVTTFLLNTCRLPPRLSEHDIQAAGWCAWTVNMRPVDDEEVEFIPLVTGSVAEFYIDPMLPHVGDIDVMYHRNSMLAIPRGHPPPTQLPAEFHNYVLVCEIIDSHLPGYVYLELRYLLTEFTYNGKYAYIEYDEKMCLTNNVYGRGETHEIHGPALLTQKSKESSYLFADKKHISEMSIDVVRCEHCLSWPLQAADWPTRHRNYGWPDSATLDRVVSNGCDVVPVAHHQCREHKWMSKNQWRLSFSRAEIVLINSWTPIQQIVYHMLRYFIKTERLTDCVNNSGTVTMSNYHTKTLMLWACELKPTGWWTESLNLVGICVELLNTLSVWLTDTRCPHYFINNCNLVDNSFNLGNMASKLMSIEEEYLSTWFLSNYIGQCAQLCPFYISRLFNDVSTGTKLQKALSEIVRWRLSTSAFDLWCVFMYAVIYIPSLLSRRSLTVRSCICWMNKLEKIEKCFSVYFSLVAVLHVACKITRNGLNDELMDIIEAVLGRNFSQCCSVLSLHKTELNTSELVEFLQKFAVEHLTTFRQLEARDFGSVATIVTTDFEAMYAYKRGDYQRCLQLSTQNVRTLLYDINMPIVPIFPSFMQLLDDDIASLTALTVIVNPECRDHSDGASITQLTLSLYLMTQCQLKLHHSVTSLTQTLSYIKVAQRELSLKLTLNHLTLKLIEHKAHRFICH